MPEGSPVTRLLSPPQPPAMSPTRARERPLHGQMAVSQRPDGEETGKGKRSLSVQGTGGAGRRCRQPCSQQSLGRGGWTGRSVRARASAPHAMAPESRCCTPQGPLMSHQASPGAAGCVLLPAQSWRPWWSLLGVGAGSGEAAPPSVLSPALSRRLAVFCEGPGTQCLQLLSSAGLCCSCAAVLGSHKGGPGQRSE